MLTPRGLDGGGMPRVLSSISTGRRVGAALPPAPRKGGRATRLAVGGLAQDVEQARAGNRGRLANQGQRLRGSGCRSACGRSSRRSGRRRGRVVPSSDVHAAVGLWAGRCGRGSGARPTWKGAAAAAANLPHRRCRWRPGRSGAARGRVQRGQRCVRPVETGEQAFEHMRSRSGSGESLRCGHRRSMGCPGTGRFCRLRSENGCERAKSPSRPTASARHSLPSQRAQVFWAGRAHTAFALHRLDQHGHDAGTCAAAWRTAPMSL